MAHIFLFISLLISIFYSLFFTSLVTAADCPPLANNRVQLTIETPVSGDYRIWLQQRTPADSPSNVFVQLDSACAVPVIKNETKGVFGWVGSTDQNQPLVFNVSAGKHTLTIAGSDTTNAIDSGFFTANTTCLPTDDGTNCLLQPATNQKTVKSTPTQKVQQTPPNGRLVVLLVSLLAVAFVTVCAILLEKYRQFIVRFVDAVPGMPWHKHALLSSTFTRFIKHHTLFVSSCAAALIVLIIMLFWVIHGLATGGQRFEAEFGRLSGAAKVVEDTKTSAGAYVVFTDSAGAVAVTPQQGGNSSGGNSGGATGNPGGGNNNPGGGGSTTPAGECPAYPAFPDENCTGWQHTGVTLENCDHLLDGGNGDFWIWDDNPVKTYDKCYFSGNITVQAGNITITRSQVHGSVSYHWTSNYSLRGLKLIDVEIEQEGVAVPKVAIGGNDWECTRCDVHHGVSGMHFGDNTIIRDSYVHDMQWLDGSHGSGIATGQDHGSNSKIIHNNINCNRVNGPPICSSALSIYPEDDNGDGQTVKNVRVEKNLFNATGAYCVYAVSIPGSNIDFIDNVFGKKFYPNCAGYGPVTGYAPAGGLWVGNVWADGSGPVIP